LILFKNKHIIPGNVTSGNVTWSVSFFLQGRINVAERGKKPRIIRITLITMIEIVYKKESYNIIGLCMEVHRELGCGFLEQVYQVSPSMRLPFQIPSN
jgi:hypothetical protein